MTQCQLTLPFPEPEDADERMSVRKMHDLFDAAKMRVALARLATMPPRPKKPRQRPVPMDPDWRSFHMGSVA